MWRLHLKSISAANLERDDAGQRVLTVYTPLATEIGSPDWEEFRILRANLHVLVDPRRAFDEVRIRSLNSTEFDKDYPLSLDALGDPII